MKKETLVLTDNQMTHLIHQKVKGDNRHKDGVKEEWLVFSSQTWHDDSRFNQFVKSINEWLSHHRLPLKVINFTRFDEGEEDESESGTVEWEVKISID